MLPEGKTLYNEGKKMTSRAANAEVVSERHRRTRTVSNYTTKQCLVCGRDYTVPSYSVNRRKFCSRSCGRVNQARVAKAPFGPVRYVPDDNTYIIPIGQDYETIIDACDMDLVAIAWSVRKSEHRRYAKRNVAIVDTLGGERVIHRIVMSRVLGRPLEKSERVDHVRGIGLDNRRSNLRLATPSQNAANMLRHKKNKCGYKGVYQDPRNGSYAAKIVFNGKAEHLGRFSSAELAHEAYVRRAVELFGEFANPGYTDDVE
jgi:hypothetical protein